MNDYLLTIWKDKRIITAVSSVYGTEFVEISRFNKKDKKQEVFLNLKCLGNIQRICME